MTAPSPVARAATTLTAAPGAGFRDDPIAPDPDRQRPRRVAIVRALWACLAGWLVLVLTVCAIAEISAASTWAPGVTSSMWTPLRGVAAFVVGAGAYGGGFAPLAILCGLAAIGVYALFFGLIGAGLIYATQGTRPHPAGATAQGFAYALAMEAFLLNVVVNAIQRQPTIYESLPSWGWWAGHAAFGVALGRALA